TMDATAARPGGRDLARPVRPPRAARDPLMASPLTVVIFGASGDLTARKLIPALYNLARKNRLPAEAKIVGVARSKFTDDAFRTQMKDAYQTHVKENFDPAVWDRFAANLFYVSADAGAGGAALTPLQEWFDRNEGPAGGRRMYYLSVKPDL